MQINSIDTAPFDQYLTGILMHSRPVMAASGTDQTAGRFFYVRPEMES